MGPVVKIVMAFIGGMTAGGYCVVNAALKSKSLNAAIKSTIAKKICNTLYGVESCPSNNEISYCNINHKQQNRSDVTAPSDIYFASRKDAVEVLHSMNEVIKSYGYVSMADFYDLSGVKSPNYTDGKYGWTSVEGCKIVRHRNGYSVEFPKPLQIR